MSRRTVPSLGFPGERWPCNYILEIPVAGEAKPIQVYRWMSNAEGYNLYMPGADAASFRGNDILSLVCCIHEYINTHGGNNETQDDHSRPAV